MARPTIQSPPTPPVRVVPTTATLRADMRSILLYIQGARIVSTARETAISRLKGWLVNRLLFGLLTCCLALILLELLGRFAGFREHTAMLSALVLVLLASRTGAIVSIGRRMNDDNLGVGPGEDSIFTIASLGSGKNGLRLALLSANAFGLVVVAIFASGLPSVLGLNGGIAPVFSDASVNVLRARADADAKSVRELSDRALVIRKVCAGVQAPTTTNDTNKAAASDRSGIQKPAGQTTGSPTSAGATGSTASTPNPAAAGTSDASIKHRPPRRTKPRTAPAEPKPAAEVPPAASSSSTKIPSSDPTTEVVADRPECSAASLASLSGAIEVGKGIAAASAATLASYTSLSPTGGSATDKWFAKMAAALGLETVPDLFKLLVWAFVAGFFEQVVPDMLDGLAARSKQKK